MRTVSRADLETRLAAVQVPAGRVRGLPEVIDEPHVVERELLVSAILPGERSTRIVGKGFRSSVDEPQAPLAAPALGGATAEILHELGYAPAEIEDLLPRIGARPSGKALAGG